MLRTYVFWIAALVTAPLALASGTYAHDDAIDVLRGSPLAADTHVYLVEAAAGDVITATISWASPTADLDVRMLSPDAPSCQITPEPDAPCLVANVANRDLVCANARAPLSLGPASDSVVREAGVSGSYEVHVVASVAAPQLVAYHIDIQVAGAGSGAVTGPEVVTYVANNPVCKLPLVDG